jgi:hypothetical protein
MEKLKYLEATLTNKNYTYREIKKQIKFWECLLHSVQNILSSAIKKRK